MVKVQLFVPCVMDQLYPQTAFDTIRLLQRAGCEVVYNPEQTCCGQPLYNAGFWEEAKEIGLKFLKDFDDSYYIVSPSATCVSMIRSGYNDLFTNSIEHNTCRNIQRNIFELSYFLVNILKKEYFGAEMMGTAVFHQSCSTFGGVKIKDEPQKLLAQVGGLDVVEWNDSESCCGFGGNFAVKYQSISSAMLEQKIQNAMQVNAEYIISTDTSCLMHLQSYIDKHHIPIKTMHISEVLTTGWANI